MPLTLTQNWNLKNKADPLVLNKIERALIFKEGWLFSGVIEKTHLMNLQFL